MSGIEKQIKIARQLINEDAKDWQDMAAMDRIQQAIAIALEHGQEESAEYKAWVIDQMVRVLAGKAYESVIEEYEREDDDGCFDHWDVGLDPDPYSKF